MEGTGRSNGTLICVPLVVKTVEEIRAEMVRAKDSGADLVEIRIDHLTTFNPRQDLQFLLDSRPLPALVTYRPKWEGGEYEGDEASRLDVLRLAMELGADYVDVELKVASEFAASISGKKPEHFKLIVSSHNYHSTPSIEEIGDLVASIQASGADIVKIACTAQDVTDVARMFHVITHCQVPMIGLVMSERGLISRLLCPKFGGYLTFGIFDGGKESAPGQPTITDLLNVYNIRKIGAATKVCGIIGKPVGHSKSPLLHNAAFQSVGFDGVYVPLLVDDLASFLQVYSSPDFAWFSHLLQYTVAGREGPAVLLVHGFGGFLDHYRGNISAIADVGHRVWAITLLGFGKSEKPNIVYNELIWAELLRDFIVDVVGEPVHIVGNSIGGYFSATVAGLWPSLTKSLVLVNTAGPIVPGSSVIEISNGGKMSGFAAIGARLLLEYLRLRVRYKVKEYYPTIPERVDDFLINEMLRASYDPGVLTVLESVFNFKLPIPLNYLLDSFEGRTLIIEGTRDPLSKSETRISMFKEHCKGITIKELDAGHCPHDEVPELVNSIITQWTASLEDSFLPV